MTEADIIDIARQAIFLTIKLGGPPMMATLIVGIGISVFQALTQIQEQTLTFIPKIIVTFLVVMLMLPFMIESLVTFTHGLTDRIVSIQ